jgi:hypothetical protein
VDAVRPGARGKEIDPELLDLVEKVMNKGGRAIPNIIGKTVHSSLPSWRPSPKLDLSLARIETSIDHGNWVDPDEMLSLLDDELTSVGGADTLYTNLKLAHECLVNFKKRVGIAHWAFRHPLCRSNHSLLVMSGYIHSHALSLCGARGHPCSRRRFCPNCSYRDAEKRMGRFVASFDPGLTVGFTLS